MPKLQYPHRACFQFSGKEAKLNTDGIATQLNVDGIETQQADISSKYKQAGARMNRGDLNAACSGLLKRVFILWHLK